MIKLIKKVPDVVRDTALHHFVQKCKEMHSIAFMQWRMKFPNEKTEDKPALESLILKRINHFYETLCDHQKVSEYTLQ